MAFVLSQSATSTPDSPSAPTLPSGELVGTMVGGGLLVFVLSILLSVTIFGMAVAVRGGEAPPSVATWLRGLRRSFAYAGTTILLSIATTLAMAPLACGMIVVVLAGGFTFGALMSEGGSASPGAMVLLALIALPLLLVGFVLSLLPALYLSARWIAAIPLVIERSAGPIAALRGSWKLTSKDPWRCLGFVAILGLISLFLILPAAYGTAMPAAFGADALPTAPALSLPRIVVNAIVGAFVMSLTAVATVLFYDDLRAREIERAAVEAVPEVGLPVE
jgi:hypothetical protein